MAKVYGGKLNAISRGLRLHRAGMKVLRGGSSLLEMTPIYDGLTTFAEYYTNFTPTGSNSTLEIVFYKQGSKIQTIAFGDASAFSIALDASDVLTFNLISNVELNGVTATSGVTTVPDGYYVLTGDLDITSDIKYYAANATPANFFGIQIHSMKNLDNYDTGRTEYPVNGRDVVELDGLTQYGEIPAWSATNGVIEFDVITRLDSNDEGFVSSKDKVNRIYQGNDNNLYSFGYANAELNEVPTPNAQPFPTGEVVHVGCTSTTGQLVEVVGLGAVGTSYLGGFLANLRLTDLDNPSNSRHYPLDRADIIQDVNEPDFPELVVNGDFEDGLNGYNSQPIASAINGQLVLETVGTDNAQVTQSFSAEIGKSYIFTINKASGVDIFSTLRVSVGVTENGTGVLPLTSIGDLPSGSYSFEFTATAEVLWLRVINSENTPSSSVTNSISIKQTTQGQWINAPQAVHRPNNSIDINTIKRSKDAPSASDNLLINSLGSVGEELARDELSEFYSPRTSSTLSDNDGVMTATATGGTFGIAQAYTNLTVGALYDVSVDVRRLSSTAQINVRFYDSPSLTGGGFINYLDPHEGVASATLKATADVMYLGLIQPAPSVGDQMGIGNISVRETTRNIGEIKNMVGYELVNRGE